MLLDALSVERSSNEALFNSPIKPPHHAVSVPIKVTAVAFGADICDADVFRKYAAVQKDHADCFPEAQLILSGHLPRLQDIEVPEPVPVLFPETVRYIAADFIAIR